MFFTGPIWLSILIPIFFAPVLLIVSLALRPRDGVGADRSALLAAAGFALAWLTGGAMLAAVLVGLVLFTHWIAFPIERAVGREGRDASAHWLGARAWLGVAVAADIVVAAAIVRAGLIVGPLRGISAMIVPFGVSYFAFHGISYVVDVYRRRAFANRSRRQLAVHLVLLPMIAGGPVGYESVAPQLAHGWPSLSDYSYGVRRLLIGVWKVFVMAAIAARQADAAFALKPGQLSAFAAWLGLISFTLQIYYAFSGYADMGLGVARMLGLRLAENFRWPYVAQTIDEFWRRWHLGLSGWFRDYVDVPPDGDRMVAPSAGREALVVLLCGIWYGQGWTFVVWGLYHAALIALERAGLEAAVKRMPPILRHVYLIVVIMAGWVILRSADARRRPAVSRGAGWSARAGLTRQSDRPPRTVAGADCRHDRMRAGLSDGEAMDGRHRRADPVAADAAGGAVSDRMAMRLHRRRADSSMVARVAAASQWARGKFVAGGGFSI